MTLNTWSSGTLTNREKFPARAASPRRQLFAAVAIAAAAEIFVCRRRFATWDWAGERRVEYFWTVERIRGEGAE
ncbi:unnamed protein product [Hymenolepis diminuta]|uniref:Transmembrane protein n=1 Tax=Hymenolepis diminuta TaxID=6216 RepID=A0A0R3SUN4_HYMDI|nr:unnamed protein product [Hymenolepis diminuta]